MTPSVSHGKLSCTQHPPAWGPPRTGPSAAPGCSLHLHRFGMRANGGCQRRRSAPFPPARPCLSSPHLPPPPDPVLPHVCIHTYVPFPPNNRRWALKATPAKILGPPATGCRCGAAPPSPPHSEGSHAVHAGCTPSRAGFPSGCACPKDASRGSSCDHSLTSPPTPTPTHPPHPMPAGPRPHRAGAGQGAQVAPRHAAGGWAPCYTVVHVQPCMCTNLHL